MPSLNLSNIFTDAFPIIESNLTIFDINNLRIARYLPSIDLKTCTVDQILDGIRCGTDFRDLPININILKYGNVHDLTVTMGAATDLTIYRFVECIDVYRNGDIRGYEWISHLNIKYVSNIIYCLLRYDSTEAHHNLAKQVVAKYIQSPFVQVDNHNTIVMMTLKSILGETYIANGDRNRYTLWATATYCHDQIEDFLLAPFGPRPFRMRSIFKYYMEKFIQYFR